ncbi:MAG: tRNA-dihydrouridine synthase [Marinifilaceae bacterium]
MESTFRIESAPLQGFTDHCAREAHHKFFGGVDGYYTPFIRIERGEFRNRDMRDSAQAINEQGRTIAQVLPGNGEEMERFVELLKAQGHTHCDLNFGCPFPMIAKRERGAGLLKSVEAMNEIADVVNATKEIGFSVKMRLGWDNAGQGVEAMNILNATSLSHITIHARYGVQGYKGEVNMDDFAALLKQSKHPVLYNGDLNSVDDIKRIQLAYPDLAGVALGRGLVARPWLALSYYEGELAEEQIMERFRMFYNSIYEYYMDQLQGEHQLLAKMQSYWEYWLPDVDRKLLKAVRKAGSLRNYNDAVLRIFR